MILLRIGPEISKQTTRFRKPISAQERLVVTLRFLVTGESYSSLMYQFRISEATISSFVPEVCDAIFTKLSPDFMAFPSSIAESLAVVDIV
jgi:hypothetical protein